MAFPNPGGRPKEKPFRDALNMEIKDAGDDHKALRRIARALLQNAYEGKMDAIKEVADRLDGKVPQGIENGDDNKPFRMTFEWLKPSE
jgi:hypothetical protein